MKKFYVLLGTFASCCLVGCGSDENERLVSDTLAKLSNTTTLIEQIRKTVGDAVTDAKNNKKPLAKAAILKATEEAGQLKGLAEYLQRLKGAADFNKDSITPDQRNELAKKHKKAFQKGLVALDQAQKALDVTMREADAIAESDPDARANLKLLREKLKEGQDEFEVLSKRQG